MIYTNPILHGDYSDPDVIRVGEYFYMVSSSFTYLPGIPVLRSANLVQWELIGYAASKLPFERYNVPVHKCGTFAPSLRYHNGLFYVYVCLPDEGLFAFTAKDPAGEWETHYVKDVCGWIDPCPLFDDDGSAYLVHGFAASRAGINNILYLHRMSPDGFKILDFGKLVYSGDDNGDNTVEGPKIYRINGKYYILTPAGGVPKGYQLALRADSPYGPYERKVVQAQGSTDINGPHQGGLIDDINGRSWFIHFRDAGAYGRVPYLQRVTWVDGWPIIGNNGEPEKGGDTLLPVVDMPDAPVMSDYFRNGMSLAWQWQANPDKSWYETLPQGLRLFAAKSKNVFEAGQFLSQLMQARDFDMDTEFTITGENARAGAAMMGWKYACCELSAGKIVLTAGESREFGRHEKAVVSETTVESKPYAGNSAHIKIRVRDGRYRFMFGMNENALEYIGPEFEMSPGGWTSARPGIFCMSADGDVSGYADFAYCAFTSDGRTL